MSSLGPLNLLEPIVLIFLKHTNMHPQQAIIIISMTIRAITPAPIEPSSVGTRWTLFRLFAWNRCDSYRRDTDEMSRQNACLMSSVLVLLTSIRVSSLFDRVSLAVRVVMLTGSLELVGYIPESSNEPSSS